MKKPSIVFGAGIGALTSLPLMAVAFLGQQLLSLPFPPFELFDWVARTLPGRLITFGIDSMIAIIRTLNLGQTSDLAKAAERTMALVLFLMIGALFGMLLSWFTRRRAEGALPWTLGTALVAALAFLLIHAALSRPGPGLAVSAFWFGALMLVWGYSLDWLFRVGPPAMALEPEAQFSRRQFMYLVGGGVLTIGLGSLALSRLGSGSSSSSGSSGTSPEGPADLTMTSGPAASPPREILSARPEPAPGIRPELTPPDDFYTVDINAVAPRVDSENWRLRLEGLVDNPLVLTLDDIRSRPSFSQVITLSCISNPIGGDLIGTAIWTGIRAKDLLAEAGVQPGAQELAIESVDGFYESVPMNELMDDRTLLVYEMNGEPLTVTHGFPLRIYIPNHYGMKQPKWIERMEVIDHNGPGYWVDRGWSSTAFVNSTSVIDAVEAGAIDAENGTVPMGGIAYTGARGVSKVEVQVDDGPWVSAQLRDPGLSPLSWVQWRYDWPVQTGQHTARVRAYDGSGALQSVAVRGARPDGATGVDQFSFTVS